MSFRKSVWGTQGMLVVRRRRGSGGRAVSVGRVGSMVPFGFLVGRKPEALPWGYESHGDRCFA